MQAIRAPDLVADHDPSWVDVPMADAWLAALLGAVPWRQESVRLFGREIPSPRLTAWYGDPGCVYTYSGLTLEPLPWTPLLASIRERVEAGAGQRFNSVLLNRYRDGSDSMGWHADDERELGPEPTIASVSLGARRTFQLKHKTRKEQRRLDVDLEHGSLLVMRPPTQAHWLHGVPKRRGADAPGERVNLTFRHIQGAG